MLLEEKQIQNLLDSALKEAAFSGWCYETILNAAKSCDIDDVTLEINFPNGLKDIDAALIEHIDSKMMAILEQQDINKLKIRERIKYAVITRLAIYEENKTGIANFASHLIKPTMWNFTIRKNAHTSHIIWRWAGDTSTDYNFYTKRGLLMRLMRNVTLYWLGDESENHKNTDNFIDREIERIMMIPKIKAKAKDFLTPKRIIGLFKPSIYM